MILQSPFAQVAPPRDCPLCPRMVELRTQCRAEHPDWWNAPVPGFGDPQARIVIVGLAPGRMGANRTGRPFTGDDSGVALFAALTRHGLVEGDGHGDDGVTLRGAAIINAVHCLPPQNRPTPEEARNCRPFLDRTIEALPQAQVFVALGEIAHRSTVKLLGGKLPKARFAHLAEHRMPDGRVLIDSYHCSRYNRNTGRLTDEMFDAVFALAVEKAG